MLPLLLIPALSMGFHDGEHGPASVDPHAAETVRFFEARVDAQPGDLAALSRLATARLDLARASGDHSHYHAAESDFRRWLDAGGTEAGIGLAYALLGQHRFEEALGYARGAAEAWPGEPQVWALLGDLHLALGHSVEAELAYRSLLDEGLTLHSLARMAQVHQLRGRVDEARSHYLDALQAGELLEEPAATRAWCHDMLGDLDFDAGLLANAREHYEKALALHPASHASVLRLAQLDGAAGDWHGAEHRLRDLVETYPRPAYWMALGDALARQGHEREAGRWFALAEKHLLHDLDHGDPGHARELAQLYLRTGRDLDLAIGLARRDLRDVRQEPESHETLAWALHRSGRSDEALDSMKAALRPGPSSVRLLARASEVFLAAGKTVEAERLRALARDRSALLTEEQGWDDPTWSWVLSSR